MLKGSARKARRTIALMTTLAVLAGAAAFGEQVHVQIANAKVKKAAQWFAPTVAEPAFADTLEVLKKAGDWYQVQAGEKTGWIHKSAVTAKKIKKSRASTVGSTQTSADDVTLAGKGFTELEGTYRKDGGKGNLEALDAMQGRSVTEDKVLVFLRAGALRPKQAKRGKK